MKIYLIRHGMTESNKTGVINGQRLDEPLSDEGRIQVQQAIDNLPVKFSKIYVSDMIRTRETAEILNESLNIPMTYHDEFKEVDLGSLSGTRWSEHKEKGIDVWSDFVAQTYDFVPYGGESFEQVRNRVSSIIEKIKSEDSNENVLIVSHGGIVRAMNKIYKNDDLIHSTQNAGIYEFEV